MRIIPLALVAFFGLAACNGQADTEPDAADADGQPGSSAPMADMDPEMLELMMEAQEIQQQLAPIQQEAMEDEALANQLEEVQQRVEEAMRDENPDLVEQMEQLEADFMAAQASGDEQRLQEIGMEAQGIQMELQALQADVLERPAISELIDAFEETRRERMVEIDPEAAELLDRIDEIVERIESG